MLALKTAAFRPLKVTAGSRARGAVPVLELSAVHFVRPSRTHLRVAPFAGPVLHEKSVETRDVTLLRPHGPGAQDTARPALRIGDWRALGDLELGRTQNRRHTRDADPVFQEVAHIAADPAIFCPDEGAGLRLRRTLQALSVVPRSAVKCEKTRVTSRKGAFYTGTSVQPGIRSAVTVSAWLAEHHAGHCQEK